MIIPNIIITLTNDYIIEITAKQYIICDKTIVINIIPVFDRPTKLILNCVLCKTIFIGWSLF